MNIFTATILSLICLCSLAHANECLVKESYYEQTLPTAMKEQKYNDIIDLVNTEHPPTGYKINEPEIYEQAPSSVAPPTEEELRRFAAIYLTELAKQSWWLKDTKLAPSEIPYSLQRAAHIIRGSLAVGQSISQLRPIAMDIATGAANYLIQASNTSGFDGTPLPHWQGRKSPLGKTIDLITAQLTNCNSIDTATNNGWLMVHEKSDLHFVDTGLAGEALFALYRETNNISYYNHAIKLTQWAVDQSFSTNFYNNAQLIHLFIDAWNQEQNDKWISLAINRAVYGVIPGMMHKGDYKGYWTDPNANTIEARTSMLRALMRLSKALAHHGTGSKHAKFIRFVWGSTKLTLAGIEDQLSNNRAISQSFTLSEIYELHQSAKALGAKFGDTNNFVKHASYTNSVALLRRGDISTDASIGIFIANQFALLQND